MPYFSYMEMKIVHEQMIAEALECSCLYMEPETPKRVLLQTCATFLTRFINRPAQKSERKRLSVTKKR